MTVCVVVFDVTHLAVANVWMVGRKGLEDTKEEYLPQGCLTDESERE